MEMSKKTRGLAEVSVVMVNGLVGECLRVDWEDDSKLRERTRQSYLWSRGGSWKKIQKKEIAPVAIGAFEAHTIRLEMSVSTRVQMESNADL